MKSRIKRLPIAVILPGLICGSIVGWSAIKVAAWVRELPSRIVIDGDAMANAFGSAVVQAYHDGLINGDRKTQTQIIRDLTVLVATDFASQEWVRTEYSTDLHQLALSPDGEVAALAGELLTLLPEPQTQCLDNPQAKTTDKNDITFIR